MNNTHTAPTSRPARKGWLKSDVLSSLVVFLVALPLCMGIARACGLPVIHGIVTGIVGGLVVGWLAGSPLQVSGPAAGLFPIVALIVQEPNGLHLLAVCLALAGVIQMAAGLLKLGQWFRAVSPAVIEGMLAGIGLLIILSQFPAMVDGRPPEAPVPPQEAKVHPAPPPEPGQPAVKEEGLLADLKDTAEDVWEAPVALHAALFPAEGSSNTPWALAIGVLTISVLVAWRPLAPRPLKIIPAAFVAVIVATLATLLLPAPVKTIEPVGNFAAALQGMTAWPSPGELVAYLGAPGVAWKVAEYTVMLAFVASAETLLCASAVDKMTPDGQRTKYDRELFAQGVGNLLCGLLHALPMTGVIVRSKANVEAGARSRVSAILHGLWLLVFVSLFPFLLQLIPVAALAAVLVFTGFRLINVRAVRELRKADAFQVVVYLVTLASVVVFNLLHGVIIGSVLALAKLLYTFSHLAIKVEADAARKRTVMHLEGAATFLRLPQLAAALERVAGDTELHVHLERLRYIDHACLELVMTWERQHRAAGGRLVIDWDSLHARFRGPRERGRHPTDGEARAEKVAAEPQHS